MKRVTALASAISLCLLAGSLNAQQQDTRPATDPYQTGEATRGGDTPATRSDSAESEMRTHGEGASTEEATRTADASMQRSRMDTEEFVKKAGAAGAAEVKAGKLGAEKATHPEVRAFAQRMVTDHTKANKELMTAAKAKNLEVPTEPDLMHKAMFEKLELQKADADFDHDFMQQMVRDHEKAVELYQQAATATNVDPTFRSVAKEKLPTLKEHLEEARRLEAKLAKEQ